MLSVACPFKNSAILSWLNDYPIFSPPCSPFCRYMLVILLVIRQNNDASTVHTLTVALYLASHIIFVKFANLMPPLYRFIEFLQTIQIIRIDVVEVFCPTFPFNNNPHFDLRLS